MGRQSPHCRGRWRPQWLSSQSYDFRTWWRPGGFRAFISDFEDTAIKLAAEQGYDYVICGHIHQPISKVVEIDGKTVHYLNSGDWVENLTALEYNGHNWAIHTYSELDYAHVNPKLRVKSLQSDKPQIEHILHNPSLEDFFRTIVRKDQPTI